MSPQRMQAAEDAGIAVAGELAAEVLEDAFGSTISGTFLRRPAEHDALGRMDNLTRGETTRLASRSRANASRL